MIVCERDFVITNMFDIECAAGGGTHESMNAKVREGMKKGTAPMSGTTKSSTVSG